MALLPDDRLAGLDPAKRTNKRGARRSRSPDASPAARLTNTRRDLPADTQAALSPHTAPPLEMGEWKIPPRYEMVNAFLRFARSCHELRDELKAEAYIAHGVEAMPAADLIASTVGGRAYCDVIEVPSFTQRGSEDNWHPSDHALFDRAIESYLRRADGLSTVGWALAGELRHYGPPVRVIPNYRHAEAVPQSTELRDRCGLGAGDVLLLATSTIYSGFEPVIEALRLLPDNVHLATLGTIVRECREQLHSYPGEIGVQHRVHFFDEVPYAQLAELASGANLGLIALNTAILNHRLAFPNRLFDTIAAGLPIVTPNVPDIARIVGERQIGVIVDSNDAYCWAEAIKAALAAEHEMRPRVAQAAQALSWESLGDELHEAYGYPTSVTILGFGNLVGHQRTLRMANSFVRRGASVTICCAREQADAVPEMPGIRFVFTQNSLGSAVNVQPLAAAVLEHLRDKAARYEALAPEIPKLRSKAEQWDRLPVPSLLRKAEQYDALQQELPDLRYRAEQYVALSSRLPELSFKAERYDRLDSELPALRYKAEQWDKLQLPALLQKAEHYDALQPLLPTLRHKAEQFDDLSPKLPALLHKAERYDALEAELPSLRHRAERYQALEAELPSLRHKAESYEALEADLPALRYKAEEWDKLRIPLLLHKAAQYDALEPELPALRHKAQQYDGLEPQLPALFHKAQQFEVVSPELPALRHKSARFDELAPALPALRFKAERYDVIEPDLPVLRQKAERHDELAPGLPELFRKAELYDRLEGSLSAWRAKEHCYDYLVSKPWLKFVFRMLGISLALDGEVDRNRQSAVAKGREESHP